MFGKVDYSELKAIQVCHPREERIISLDEYIERKIVGFYIAYLNNVEVFINKLYSIIPISLKIELYNNVYVKKIKDSEELTKEESESLLGEISTHLQDCIIILRTGDPLFNLTVDPKIYLDKIIKIRQIRYNVWNCISKQDKCMLINLYCNKLDLYYDDLDHDDMESSIIEIKEQVIPSFESMIKQFPDIKYWDDAETYVDKLIPFIKLEIQNQE